MSSLSSTHPPESEPEQFNLADEGNLQEHGTRTPEGLVRADQLPPASDAFAQMFPADEPGPTDSSGSLEILSPTELNELSPVGLTGAIAANTSSLREEITESYRGSEVPLEVIAQGRIGLSSAEPAGSAGLRPEGTSEADENSQHEAAGVAERACKLPGSRKSLPFATIATRARNLLHGVLARTRTAGHFRAQVSSPKDIPANRQAIIYSNGSEEALFDDAHRPVDASFPGIDLTEDQTTRSVAKQLDSTEILDSSGPFELSPQRGTHKFDDSSSAPISNPFEPLAADPPLWPSEVFTPQAAFDASLRPVEALGKVPRETNRDRVGFTENGSDVTIPNSAIETFPEQGRDPLAEQTQTVSDCAPEATLSYKCETELDTASNDAGSVDLAIPPPLPADRNLDPPVSEINAEECLQFADTIDDDEAIALAIDRFANLSSPAAVVQSDDRQTPRTHDHAADLGSDEGGVDTAAQIRDIEELPTSGSQSSLDCEPAIADNPPDASSACDSTEQAPPLAPAITYRDWSFEEKIASHHEWIESKGRSGKKADLSAADLEGAELIGVDLRFVDLHDATLRAADLLMTDLRDACLVRANFRDSCLVGANLEAANLEGAFLDTSMGLVPRQLAGANLHQAMLPPQLLAFESLSEFKRASRTVYSYFIAIMSFSVLSCLAIWMTRDSQLLTNSALLPFLHSSAAAAAMPTQQFYLIAPFALFIVYLVFQFHLQHLWDLVLELPAIFPDGRVLGENEPRIVIGLLRTHFRWMSQDAPSTRIIEKAVSVLIAYWVVPATLLLFWLRFLTLQNIHGTVFQILLVVGATATALYSTTKVGRPAEAWMLQQNAVERLIAKCERVNLITAALIVLGVLTFLSAGTMLGVPHGRDRAPQFLAGSIRRWAPMVLWSVGTEPYADLTEAVISIKPANWNGSDDQVSSVKGARLNDSNFRYAQAYRVFLVNAHLLHAKFEGAFLSQADLRGADLGQGNLRYAILDQALLSRANLDRAVLDGADLSRADLRGANLSYASLEGATLVDARLDGTTLYGGKLPAASLIRANFEKADLRESHLEGSNLEHANLQGSYLWSSKLVGAHLNNARLGNAIFVDADLRGADLRWADLAGTVLTGADLTGALLDGADFRTAVGFGPNQICSAKSRQGLLLTEAMQGQVIAQCGLSH